MADPHISVQIPLLVLGTHTYHDDIPIYHPEPAVRTTNVLEVLAYTIQAACEGVYAAIWQGREWDARVDCAEDVGGGVERARMTEGSRSRWWDRECARWNGVKKGWVVRSGVLPTNRFSGDEGKRSLISMWRENSEGLGYIGSYQPDDNTFPPRADSRRRDAKLWSVPIVLQRFDIPIQNSSILLQEVWDIMSAVKKYLSWEGAVDGKGVKALKIIGVEKGDLRVCFTNGEAGKGKWGPDLVSKVILAMTGWEREITVTGSMSSLLAYSPLSRFLSHWGIEQLRYERRCELNLHSHPLHHIKRKRKRPTGKEEAGRDLENGIGNGGPHPLLSKAEKSNDWTWRSEILKKNADDVIESIEKPGVWKNWDDVWRKGEEEVGACVREMGRCEGKGVRLAIALPVTSSPSPSSENKQLGSSPGPTDADADFLKADITICPSRTKSRPLKVQPPDLGFPAPFPKIEAIIFQGHRSSTDGVEVAAYIDMIIQLFLYVSSNTYVQLRTAVSDFRTMATDMRLTPHQSLMRLLPILEVQRPTLKVFNGSDFSLVDKDIKGNGSGSGTVGVDSVERWNVSSSVFSGVMDVLERRMRREREYLPVFMERYAAAGGWDAVGGGSCFGWWRKRMRGGRRGRR